MDDELPACCAASSSLTKAPCPSPNTSWKHFQKHRDRKGQSTSYTQQVSRTTPQLLKPWPFGNSLPFPCQVWPAKNKHALKIISDVSCIQLPVSSGVSSCKTAERKPFILFSSDPQKSSLWRRRFCSWRWPVKNQDILHKLFTPQTQSWHQISLLSCSRPWGGGSVTMVVTSFRLTHLLSWSRNGCTMGVTTEEHDFRQPCFCQIQITQYKTKKIKNCTP